MSQDAERLVEAALERFGRIDVLVNNASELGPSPMPALDSLGWQDMERILRVNVMAPLHLTQLVLPADAGARRRRDHQRHVRRGRRGVRGLGRLRRKQGGARAHVPRAGRELEGTGIRVYVVDPGDMNTEMHRLAEPGVDLSGLPGPGACPRRRSCAWSRERRAAFGRFKAQATALARDRCGEPACSE